MSIPLWLLLVIFHPVLITLAIAIILALILWRTGWWARHKWRILAAAAAAWLIDAAFALPRIAYGWSLPAQPVIARKIAPPKSLVIIHAGCRDECQRWLADGTIDEVIAVDRDFTNPADWNAERAAVRCRTGDLPGRAMARTSVHCSGAARSRVLPDAGAGGNPERGRLHRDRILSDDGEPESNSIHLAPSDDLAAGADNRLLRARSADPRQWKDRACRVALHLFRAGRHRPAAVARLLGPARQHHLDHASG
jgi:hypothetical protein